MTDAEVTSLAVKIDALHEDVLEVKELQKATNGRLRAVELWKARGEGVRAAYSWVMPFAISLVGGAGAYIVAALISH